MSNKSPVEKAVKIEDKYYNDKLPPKQKVMYDLTNIDTRWSQKEILEHYNDVVELLSKDSLNKLLN